MLGLVISSCVSYAPHTLPPLFDSIARHSIRPEDVLVVISSSRAECSMATLSKAQCMALAEGYGAHVAMVDYTCFDMTALSYLADRGSPVPEWTHVFLVHDTVELRKNVIQEARPACAGLRTARRLIGGRPSMNMGVYALEHLRKQRAYLRALRWLPHTHGDLLRAKHDAVSSEDILFDSTQPPLVAEFKIEETTKPLQMTGRDERACVVSCSWLVKVQRNFRIDDPFLIAC